MTEYRDMPHLAQLGFPAKRTGGHMARSMMFLEIETLCRTLPADAAMADYQRVIVQDNLLGKPTFGSREKSYHHLVELYGLSPDQALFRVFRKLAAEDHKSLPLLALICCYCRDPQLRHSFTLLQDLKAGEILTRTRMEDHLEAGFPSRFSDSMKKSLAQNVNTSWTFAGHLEGRCTKRRIFPEASASAAAFAMFAGWLSGLRGQILLHSVFTELVGSTPDRITYLLASASSRGWLRFRHAGGVTEIDFSSLLTTEELALAHVTH